MTSICYAFVLNLTLFGARFYSAFKEKFRVPEPPLSGV